jgi:hypothetical protein
MSPTPKPLNDVRFCQSYTPIEPRSWHEAKIKAWHHAGLFYVRSIWQRTVMLPSLFCPRTTQLGHKQLDCFPVFLQILRNLEQHFTYWSLLDFVSVANTAGVAASVAPSSVGGKISLPFVLALICLSRSFISLNSSE